ncbi:unnamed protein product [Calypogeia fissa]
MPSVVQPFWMSLVGSFVLVIGLLLTLQVRAQQEFSLNPYDYDFGWLVAGAPPRGQVPGCAYCVNALDDALPYLNRVVGLYSCEGLQYNELWAYQNSTGSIILWGILSNSAIAQALCLDALLWNSTGEIQLLPCNSSVDSQSWTWEGNNLRSGLTDHNGSAMYLWGEILDQQRVFNNIILPKSLSIASTAPDNPSVGSYTSSFTFLSTKNWVDNSSIDIESNTLITEGLVQIANLPQDQISNGGFEMCTYTDVGPSFRNSDNVTTSYFPFCGWVIHNRAILYVKDGMLPPANGSYSIHLGPTGSISQTFRTEKGKEYSLSFYFTWLPPAAAINFVNYFVCSDTYNEVHLQVHLTSNSSSKDKPTELQLSDGTIFTQTFNSSLSNLTTNDIGWRQETVIFTALTNVTTVSFNSLNLSDSCGSMLDTVQLSPTVTKKLSTGTTKNMVVLAVAGSIGGVVGLIATIGFVYGLSYSKVHEDYSGLYKTKHARLYSERELNVATKRFSSILGEGGFGTVYKADLPDGTEGAVKVEKRNGPNVSTGSSKVRALDEIAVLLRVHHRNLVNLIGFCINKGRHMLVFEYLPNGSLYDRLHPSILAVPPPTSTDSMELSRLCSTVIPWKQRVRIAADVARGLEYLHHEADPPIVHRDVKSRNILLTATDSAKLADFGLSKAAPVNATSFQSIETMVRGSLGYLDPQYCFTGMFSSKSDVYSFGVVLLELISGHDAIYHAEPLASWAAPYMTSPSLYHELVDKKLNGAFDAHELETLVDLSRLCIQEDGKMRPNMRQVVAFLNSSQVSGNSENAGEKPTNLMEEYQSRESYNYEKMQQKFIGSESHRSIGGFLTMSVVEPRD